MYGKFVSVFLLVSGIVYDCSAVTDHCPLWHVKRNGLRVCQCGASINEAIFCGGIDTIAVTPGYCMTWDDVSQNAVVNRCLLSRQIPNACQHHVLNAYLVIPTNLSGPELNYMTCIKNTIGKGSIVGSVLMAMDLLHFRTVSLVPIVLNSGTSGF